jgi:hypothetical protein
MSMSRRAIACKRRGSPVGIDDLAAGTGGQAQDQGTSPVQRDPGGDRTDCASASTIREQREQREQRGRVQVGVIVGVGSAPNR